MRLIPARLWCLTILSGVLQVWIFPIAGPVPVWRTTFCWVALLPLFHALLGESRDGRSLTAFQGSLLAYSCGILWYLGNCYWIYQTMYLYGGLPRPVAGGILVLFCLYLGLYHAVFGAMLAVVHRSKLGRQGALLLAPFLWVSVELARARITGLPWDLLGIAQVDNPLLSRLAPYTGAYGLSFVIAAVNALWLVRITLRQRRFTRPLLTAAGVAVIVVYVFWLPRMTFRHAEGASARATLVQENLEVGAANTGPQETEAQMLNSFALLSMNPAPLALQGIPELTGTQMIARSGRESARATGVAPDLIVWPESPAPFEFQEPQFRAGMATLARASGAPIIVGNTAFARSVEPNNKRGYELRNAAAFVAPDGSFAGRYDKMHLVPFGEYVPFRRMFFFAGSLLAEVGTFEPGRERTVFSAGGHRYGTFICYESIFGDEIRQFALGGAEVLVNISNDGWYGNTSAPWQHLNMVRMRAIENHRWILRATNTGVTAAIDPWGRVTEAAPRHIRTSIRVRFGFERVLTFYTRFGDVFAYLCSGVTLGALIYALIYALKFGPNHDLWAGRLVGGKAGASVH